MVFVLVIGLVCCGGCFVVVILLIVGVDIVELVVG